MNSTPSPHRILLVEGNAILRAGLESLVAREPGCTIAASTGSPHEAIQLSTTLHPDLVLTAGFLPGMDGVALTRHLRARSTERRVLILAAQAQVEAIGGAFRAGARGYVVRQSGLARLCEAIRRVLAGEYYLDAPAIRAMVRWLACTAAARVGMQEQEHHALTVRECEILSLLSRGLNAAEAATRLGIAAKTVSNHRANLMRKLSLKGSMDLVRYAWRSGLFDPCCRED
jgi:DNA-binding NarL/FixJ family response regulator